MTAESEPVSSRYRVLMVCSHPVQYMAPLLREMARHPKLDLLVAYCSMQGAEPGIDPEFGVQVSWDVPLLEGYRWIHVRNHSHRPGLRRFFGLLNLGLWKLVRGGRFDAVVSYVGYAFASFWTVVAAAKITATPFLFGTDATSLLPRDGQKWKVLVKRLLIPKIFRLADVSLAPSQATIEFFRGLGIAEKRIVLTPFVVDNDWWIQETAGLDRTIARSRLNLAESVPVVLYCAKLQPWKRPGDLLRAFAKANLPHAVLLMAGDGPLRDGLEVEAQELGIATRVRFLGFVNQSALPSLYCAADIMVLPSESDACPAAVCEALLCGCPVVISDAIRGRFDLILPGRTGFIYPCGDVGALARILTDVLPDREQMRKLKENAKKRMETWSPRENVEGMVEAIQIAMNQKDGRNIK